MTVSLHCDLNQTPLPLRHAWRECVGSSHAVMALRADWQRQLRLAHDELGFRCVRMHGILDDAMGTVVCQDRQLLYSFHNADLICDFLLEIGMRPLVELSFMPGALASGDTTVFHYRANVTPPADMAQWADLLRRLAAHWVARYGIDEVAQWRFEVWNEPNLAAFWPAGKQAYFALYAATAAALKRVDERLQVGGPATAQNAWIGEFLAWCAQHGAPVDFISTHYYPTDAFGQPGTDTVTQLAHAPPHVMRVQACRARAEAGALPLLYTEWSVSSNPRDPLHDAAFGAALALRSALDVDDQVDAFSYWTFSDLFEENYFPDLPFHGGFGLLSMHGVRKPVYRAFELLAALGTRHYPLAQNHPSVRLWVGDGGDTGGKPDQIRVLFINQAMPHHPIAGEAVELTLRARPGWRARAATLACIDEQHGNPAQLWRRMGRPATLAPDQLARLHQASALHELPLTRHESGGQTVLRWDVAPQSAGLARLDWEPV
ncbi:MAG: beta-xylosidase [Pseudomonadota bacterium]